MAKSKTVFFCKNCGQQFVKWQGQCNSCNKWNTLEEEIVVKPTQNKNFKGAFTTRKSAPKRLVDIQEETEQRVSTSQSDFDRILGGGLVPGSVTLLGGEPGIGKSTLMLQLALKYQSGCLYVSGEESENQIKLRAQRISQTDSDCFILTETNTQILFKHFVQINPTLIIIDSIQTLYSERIDAVAGSVSQIKTCTAELIEFAKKTHTSIILIGHITKDGHIAGPKILEHMVDTVLQFEGDRNHLFRLIRAYKNRFGSTQELAIYEMKNSGLIPVLNPSEILLSKNHEKLSGQAIAASLEGMQPLMVEVQALVSNSVYGTPQRSTTGFNIKRLNMLLAVLEKRAGFKLGSKDVFLNIAGGISIQDPSTDLAVLAAIQSSAFDIEIEKHICFAAEVGLSGEIRPVSRIDQRIKEAEKLGFQEIYISEYVKPFNLKTQIEIIKVKGVEDFMKTLYGSTKNS